MTDSHDMSNLQTPITGEIPDDIPGDGGSGPSTESQILDDADLTDIPEPNIQPPDDPLPPAEIPQSDSTLTSTSGQDGEQDPTATLGESGETRPV